MKICMVLNESRVAPLWCCVKDITLYILSIRIFLSLGTGHSLIFHGCLSPGHFLTPAVLPVGSLGERNDELVVQVHQLIFLKLFQVCTSNVPLQFSETEKLSSWFEALKNSSRKILLFTRTEAVLFMLNTVLLYKLVKFIVIQK